MPLAYRNRSFRAYITLFKSLCLLSLPAHRISNGLLRFIIIEPHKFTILCESLKRVRRLVNWRLLQRLINWRLYSLYQSRNVSFVINVNIFRSRVTWKSWHSHNVSSNRNQESGSSSNFYFSYRYNEIFRPS